MIFTKGSKGVIVMALKFRSSSIRLANVTKRPTNMSCRKQTTLNTEGYQKNSF